MAGFEQLRQIWHSQSAPHEFDTAGLRQAIGRYSKRQAWVGLVKLAAVLSAVAAGVVGAWGRPLALAGEALVLAGALVFLAIDWRNRRALERLDFTLASAEFVRGARARLEAQRDPFRRYGWLFAFFFGGGMNLMLWDALRERALGARIAIHLFWTAMLPVGYLAGRWVRTRRFDADARPLLERLAALERILGERWL